jgi:DNA/RNA-binding domain of Phe-tRNA-synthetase-like protein
VAFGRRCLSSLKRGILNIQIKLPGVKLGIVEAQNVHVESVQPDLTKLLDEACLRKQKEYTVETLAEAEPIRAIRALFRAWGMDPSKYRPSSEALLRRVVQGKGLYRVSNVVDVGNLVSMETGWPLGCYDRSHIHEPVVLRLGTTGESYEGIGKKTWNLEGRPVLADPEGPFGSPISDSTRSMITDSAKDVIIVVYIPEKSADETAERALKRLCERLTNFTAAAETRSVICHPEI